MKTLAAALTLATLGHLAHGALLSTPLPAPAHEAEALPSLSAVRVLSLGYDSLAADYYWLRAISYFGDKKSHLAGYPLLPALMDRVLTLDPYFATGYHFAGTALTVQTLDPHDSVRLLQQGMRYRPNDWRIAYYLGFNLFYFLHDYAGGAQALAIAAKNPEAPQLSGPLAARLMAEAGQPEIGLQLLDSIEPSINDPALKKTYAERRRLLELELHLKWLNQAADHFAELEGRRPKSIDELLRPGLLRALPAEPLGGQYLIDNGRVVSTHEDQRLRLRM